MKIGSKFNIFLSYSNIYLHFIGKFIFFSCTDTVAGNHVSWSSAPEDLSHNGTEEHSDTTAITETVTGHEDNVKNKSKKKP